MIARFKEMSSRDRAIFLLAIIACVFGAIYYAFNAAGEAFQPAPISAEGMSVKERAEIDEAALLEELAGYGAQEVRVNYADQGIAVNIDKTKSDQYAKEDAKQMANNVKSALKERRGDMTLEQSSYYIYIYGKDGSLIEFFAK